MRTHPKTRATTGQPAWADPAARWLLLAPAGTRVVKSVDRYAAVRELRALPVGTPVAIVGRRGLTMTARQGDVDPVKRLLSLPGTEMPVAVAAAGPGMAWVANSVLTVPSGMSRGHLLATCGVLLARRCPSLLRAVGGRILLGSRL